LPRSAYTDLSYSVFGSFEENQWIHCTEGFDGSFLLGKTFRKLKPGSLLFLSGNAIHAGSRFMGSKENLLTNLPLYYQTMMPHYLNHLGDLKLFYDVPGKLILSAGDMDNDEQEWFFEVGNRYGMAVGPRSRWPDIGNVKICLENDAEGDGKCEAETIIN
jgi:hypothetical protein